MTEATQRPRQTIWPQTTYVLDASSQGEALAAVAEDLGEKGLVDSGFLAALLARERDWPTGIDLTPLASGDSLVETPASVAADGGDGPLGDAGRAGAFAQAGAPAAGVGVGSPARAGSLACLGIAVPHADPSHVRAERIVPALLRRPVPWRSMTDPDAALRVSLFFLILNDGRDARRQTDLLARIMDAVAEMGPARLCRLMATEDAQELYRRLSPYFN